MSSHPVEIEKYSDLLREQVLSVWEKSVLATHHFLTREDFIILKNLLYKLDLNLFEIYCLTDRGRVAGFIALSGRKIEMLFLSPEYIGLGLGKRLISFAVGSLNANLIDVNEQNTRALQFYRKAGFEVFERSDKDDLGKSYPLLRMKLKNNKGIIRRLFGGRF
ncbi:MAG: GNAT family N-acetyltransferase [Cytophagaceae bacterium SCN 52-12]|nr:MAG: GNAT family N-acetyltransferase [Cytophagaceae bacterium SCN 52-12]